MRFYCLIALLALVSTSCGKSQRAPQPTQTNIETKPALGSATLEPTLAPTRTAPPTLPPLPSPTPNLLTVADLPVHLGTSLPQAAAPLSPGNAGALRLLGLWGLGSPQGLEWSADGNRLVVGFQAGIRVYDPHTGGELYRIRSAGWLTGMDISPDGETLAVLHSDQTLEFYSLSTGMLISSLHEVAPNGPLSLQYAPDGESLLIGLDQGLVGLITFQGQDPALSVFGEEGYPVEHLALLPSQHRLAGLSNGQGIAIWSLEDLENPYFLYNLVGTYNSLAILDLAFSPDGRWLAASNWDEWLTLWDISGEGAPQPGQMLWEIAEGFDPPNTWNAVAFSADSQILASGADRGVIWLWDLSSAKPFLSVQAGQSPVAYLAYSPDGNTLAVTFADGQVLLLDSSTLETQHSLQTKAAWAGSLAALSADGQFLATATWAYPSDGPLMQQAIDGAGLYLRSFIDGSVIQQMDTTALEIPPSGFSSMGISPNGGWVAASPLGLPLAVWDTNSGEMAFPLEDMYGALYYCFSVLFSPNGETIAAACSDRMVSLWQADTGALWRSITSETPAQITTLAFSPDGIRLVGAGGSGPVYLWDLAGDTPERRLELYDPAPITDLFFSPDGQYLACTTGRNNPQVVIWNLATEQIVASPGFNDTVATAAFSPNNALMAIAVNFEYADMLEIRDWQKQETLAYERYYSDIMQVFFSPDGRFVITISKDGLVHIWGVYPE